MLKPEVPASLIKVNTGLHHAYLNFCFLDIWPKALSNFVRIFHCRWCSSWTKGILRRKLPYFILIIWSVQLAHMVLCSSVLERFVGAIVRLYVLVPFSLTSLGSFSCGRLNTFSSWFFSLPTTRANIYFPNVQKSTPVCFPVIIINSDSFHT